MDKQANRLTVFLPERGVDESTETAAAVGDAVSDRSLLLEVKPDD